MRRRWALLTTGLMAVYNGLGPVDGVIATDLFVLRNGGRVQGVWLNRQTSEPAEYAVRTDEGVVVKLPATEVRWAMPRDPVTTEYEQLLERCPDTVEGHWQLAEWCRTHGLKAARETQLQRILRLDPNHGPARRALGYSELRGQWVTPDEVQQQRGYRRYAGRWRLPQEIDLLEASQAVESAERRWLVRLARWRQLLNTAVARDAHQSFEELRDPQAVPALASLLQREPYRQVKLLYLDALERIGTAAATDAVITWSLQDLDEEIFHACLEKVLRAAPPLAEQRYLAALKDDSNLRVNRAAYALGQLGDAGVLSPLITALVTTHYLVIPKTSDHYTATFGSTDGGGAGGGSLGGTGFSAGQQTRVIPQTVRNPEVLTALIRLSRGMNFGYDQQAWRRWLDNELQKNMPVVDARRDAT